LILIRSILVQERRLWEGDKMLGGRLFCCFAAGFIALVTGNVAKAIAAEGAAGFYLLGSKTSMAGFLPPPGTYVQDLNYVYSGSADVALAFGGINITGGSNADVYYKVPLAIWVKSEKVLGGNVAFTMAAPIGWKDVSARASLTGPGGAIVAGKLQDDGTNFGDPVVGAMVGWHRGNWHWNIATQVNIPVGYWKKGNLASIGFNRWAFDTSAAVTHLDLTTGLELSAAGGFTFNLENPDTDYKTGTEFHFEFGAVQNFSKQFAIGLNGYFYQQVQGDSGTGATLGSFKGRTLALGPVINWSFQLGKIPVSSSLKYFREFDVKNRLEGDAGLLSFTMPLSVGR
jgi:hypothetical protein